MNAEERTHTERLLEINHARIRELEVKAATYGALEPHAHIAIELRDYERFVEFCQNCVQGWWEDIFSGIPGEDVLRASGMLVEQDQRGREQRA